MNQLELFEPEAKAFNHRARGEIRYRNFTIHEKINWKSYWIAVEQNHSRRERMRIYWAYNTIMIKDFPLETINETQEPFA